MDKDVAALFTPVKIGSAVIKNRIVFPAMCTYYSDENGSMTPRIQGFVRALAQGGVGMIILPGTPYGPGSKGRPAISEDSHISGWKDVKRIVDEYGVSLFCQLHPSKIYDAGGSGKKIEMPEEFTTGQIEGLVQAYARGALRARKAGLDGVEIPAGHKHEIAKFLSPFYNRRTDGYGGDLVGRSRYLRELIRAIKNSAGSDFPIIARISAIEMIPGGRELPESLQLVRLLEEAGADAILVDMGSSGASHWVTAPMDVPPGFAIPHSTEIKKAVSIPVIAMGRINDPLLAARTVSEGNADLVVMGRALLADHDLPKKASEGALNLIRPCIGCDQGCRAAEVKQEGVYCLQNPQTGREETLRFTPVTPENRKTVLIAGAGPAGLEAACILSERGHRVKIYEQESQAGGKTLLAARPPHKEAMGEVIRYRLDRLRQAGVEIHLNSPVDLQTVEAVGPDAVIIATGSSPVPPDFPLRGGQVYSADEVLSGKLPLGKKVLVLGGGMVGCEIADHLAEKGLQVDIVEQMPDLAIGLNKRRRLFLLERLKRNLVGIIVGAKIVNVDLPKVTLSIENERSTRGDYDAVVYALGRKPDRELQERITDRFPALEIFTVGDAQRPRTAMEAIQQSALLAAEI
jgi:2,4-dienoyl-CoA reductase-like NADH-dependent reductase (Old Yellow Enzyme family)/thioredoxin reductase